MNSITELNDQEFTELLDDIMSFLSVNPVSGVMGVLPQAEKKGLLINYIKSSVDWEEFIDGQESLETLYSELFGDSVFEGKVLFFYPFCRTKNNNPAIIIPAKDLKAFLMDKHIEIYTEYFDVEMFSFGFYFFNTKTFYGFEHPDFLYYIEIP